MAPFKVLILLIVAIISLRSKDCCFDNKNQEMLFCSGSDTVVLRKNEYSIKQNTIGFDLSILEVGKLRRISNLDKPSIAFNMKGINVTAKGIDIFSSTLPKGADYFFALNKKGGIVFIKGDTIQFTKVEPN